MNAKEIAVATFKQQFGTNPAGLAFAPGRVNLLGEHVDYNDGFVLPAAIDRGIVETERLVGRARAPWPVER